MVAAQGAQAEPEDVNTPESDGDDDASGIKGKRKVLILVVLVLLIVAGVAAFFLLKGGDNAKEKAKAEKTTEAASAVPAKPVYYDLPEFLVNLSTGTGKTSYLRMVVTLELKNQESRLVMDANKPRVLDTFNTYLRELRTTDLAGSAGIYRLREELIRRINATVEEGIVKDILFSEIVIQ